MRHRNDTVSDLTPHPPQRPAEGVYGGGGKSRRDLQTRRGYERHEPVPRYVEVHTSRVMHMQTANHVVRGTAGGWSKEVE